MQRSASERLFQAIIYEAIAIAFLTPVYSWAFNMPLGNSLATMATTLLEVTITFIAVPIIMIMSGASIWIALLADIAFSVIFAVYTYIFYYIYDRLRPVRSAA